MKVPDIAEVLKQIRDRKTKIQKLEMALRDTLNASKSDD